MKNKTAIWIRLVVSILLALLFLNILIAGIFGKFNWNFGGFHIGGTHYSNADKYSAGDASIAGADLTALEIHWIDGSVTVKQGSGDKIEIKEIANDSLDESDRVHYYMNEGRLIFQYRESNRGWNLFGSNGKNKKLEVTVPAALAEKLNKVSVDTTSSTVEVSGLHVENMSLDNVSGNVSLNQLVVGKLDSDTVSGTVKGTDLTVTKEIESDSVSGSVELQGSIEAIECDSVSGDVTIESDQTLSKMDANSTSGAVKMRIPADSQFEAELDSVSGDLNSDFSGTSKGDSFICGDSNNHYSLDSVSGDFTIQKK